MPCCGLVPGGVSKKITAGQAAAILGSITPADGVAAARRELAAEFVSDLRRIDAQMRETRRKLAAAVKASGTSLTKVFGVGPVIAAAVIGDVREVSRFPGRDHFAAYNGTAPIEVSSGKRKVHRLSRRGNRRLNHAIHMGAVTQIRNPRSEGRVYFDKKLAEGKTRKEALRSLKRHVSDAVFACLQADASQARSPGGQSGNDFVASAASSHPERQLFGQATPGPATQPYDPKGRGPRSLPSRSAATPRERSAGSRTGRSPAAQQCRVVRPAVARSRMITLRRGGPDGHGTSDRSVRSTTDLPITRGPVESSVCHDQHHSCRDRRRGCLRPWSSG